MLVFDEAYLAKINARLGGGRILKAVVLTESNSPLVKRYFVDNDTPIDFQGNTYTPLSMKWDGLKATAGMELDTMSISVSNLGSLVETYVYRLDISGNDVELQLIHEDILQSLTAFKRLHFKILLVDCADTTAVFQVGRTWGLDDRCAVMLKSEFPSLIDSVSSIFS